MQYAPVGRSEPDVRALLLTVILPPASPGLASCEREGHNNTAMQWTRRTLEGSEDESTP